MSTIMDDYVYSKSEYSYDEVAKAVSLADKTINKILEPILERFDKETREIVNKLCVCYSFNNEEEKAKLIENFQKAIKEKEKSEYSDYIKMDYEIDGSFFDVNYHISRGRFAEEQRRKIAQTIIIDFTMSGYLKFTSVYPKEG